MTKGKRERGLELLPSSNTHSKVKNKTTQPKKPHKTKPKIDKPPIKQDRHMLPMCFRLHCK